jgi:DNA-binding CsgD family transcriptional regulator
MTSAGGTMGAFVPTGRKDPGFTPGDQLTGDLPPAAVRAAMEEDSIFTRSLLTRPDDPPSAERRTWVPSPGCRIIACVDVAPVSGQKPAPAPDVLWNLAARRMERCVRPGDLICMLGGFRLAVCFGNGANRIPASALGRRLARAMGDHLVVGSTSTEVDVAVGIGIAPDDLDPSAVTEAALACVRSARHHHRRTSAAPRPLVAISRFPAGRNSPTSETPSAGEGVGAHRTGGTRLVRRLLVPVGDEGAGQPFGEPSQPALVAHPTTQRSLPRGSAEPMRVLVVDLEPPSSGGERLGAAVVAATARRMGALPTLSTASTLDTVILDHCVVEPHAVVMVLHPEPAPSASGPREDPWEAGARLTRSLRRAGSAVIAVSFGASAMSVAACVEQGAIGVFDLDDLPDELARVAHSQPRCLGDGEGDDDADASRFPAPHDGLVTLTPAERRVLHQMMQGRSAAEIAAEHTVALSTVRTHIRSILRKLNVSSQLAAVAIANGAIPIGMTRGA